MKKSILIIALFFLTLTLAITGCSDEGKAELQVVKAGINIEDIDTLDPHYAKTTSSETISHVLFNKLVRYPAGTTDVEQIEGDLAESWEFSDDKLTLTFKLRERVKWHKGYGEVTSEDVKFSLERLINDPRTISHAFFQSIARIETPDKYLVVVKFKKPDPFFIQSLCLCSSRIVSKAAVLKYGNDFKTNPIGSGPFMLEKYLPKEGVTVVANNDYFRGKPKVQRIEFFFIPDRNALLNAFLARVIDITDWKGEHQQMYDASKSNDKLIIDAYPGVPFYIFLDTLNSPTKDIRVRKALAYAIDRESYVRVMEPKPGTWDVPSFGLVPMNSLGYTKKGVEQYEYDQIKAKQMLAEAGYPDGLTIKGYCTQIALYRIPMTYVQDQLAKVGIKYDLAIVDYNTFSEKKRTGEARPLTWNVVDNMPESYHELLRFFTTDGRSYNYTGYNKVDPLIRSISSEFDTEKRKQVYREIQLIISRDVVVVPLHCPKPIMVRWNNIDLGYEPKQNDFYYYELDEKLSLK